MTPLELLREHTIKDHKVDVDGDDIVFSHGTGPEKRILKTTLTTFRAKTSKKHYDLLAIFTCLKYATLAFGEYVKKCRAEKASMVSTVDKKELLAYLRGEIDQSSQIQDIPTSVEASIKAKPSTSATISTPNSAISSSSTALTKDALPKKSASQLSQKPSSAGESKKRKSDVSTKDALKKKASRSSVSKYVMTSCVCRLDALYSPRVLS